MKHYRKEVTMKYYLRGEMAKISGVSVETLRFYEKEKLIPLPKRDSNGYRLYSENTLIILNFIKNAKEAGFSLDQIRKLFLAVKGFDIDLDYLEKFVDEKLLEIRSKVTQLESVEENLRDIKRNLHEPHECLLCNALRNVSEK